MTDTPHTPKQGDEATREAVYEIGFKAGYAAGQASRPSLDERLEQVHPEAFVDTMRPFTNWKGEPYWIVSLRRPKGPTKTRTQYVSYGEGQSAQQALDAAVEAAAREKGGQGE